MWKLSEQIKVSIQGCLVALAGRTRSLRGGECLLPVCCYPDWRLGVFKGQEHCRGLNSCAQGSLSMDLAFLLTVCWTKVTLIQYIKIVFFHRQLVHLGEWSGMCRSLFFWEVFLNISSSPFLYRVPSSVSFLLKYIKMGGYVLISLFFSSYRLKKMPLKLCCNFKSNASSGNRIHFFNRMDN